MIDWLAKDLAAAQANRHNVPWITVNAHQPICLLLLLRFALLNSSWCLQTAAASRCLAKHRRCGSTGMTSAKETTLAPLKAALAQG